MDALFCLASLQFHPRRMWLGAALSQVSRGLTGEISSSSSSSSNNRCDDVTASSSSDANASLDSTSIHVPPAGKEEASSAGSGGGGGGGGAAAAGVAKFGAGIAGQSSNGGAPAATAGGNDGPVLLGRILRQPGQEYQSLEDMVRGVGGEGEESDEEEEGFLMQSSSEDEDEVLMEIDAHGGQDGVELDKEDQGEDESFLLGSGEQEGEEGSFLMQAQHEYNVVDRQQNQAEGEHRGMHQTPWPSSGDYLASEDMVNNGIPVPQQQQQQQVQQSDQHQEQGGGVEGGDAHKEGPEKTGMPAASHRSFFQQQPSQGVPRQQQQQFLQSQSQGPGPDPYTLLVPSLAACCPLVDSGSFMRQQEQQLHHSLDAVRMAQLSWSLSAMSHMPQHSWVEAFSIHVSLKRHISLQGLW